MTKPIPAAAVLILMDRKLLSLEDCLYKYIPAFKDVHVYSGMYYFYVYMYILLVCMYEVVVSIKIRIHIYRMYCFRTKYIYCIYSICMYVCIFIISSILYGFY